MPPPKRVDSLAFEDTILLSQVMIAIGGWNEGSTKYSGMAKDKKKRQKFVNSTLDFLEKHNFDGIYKAELFRLTISQMSQYANSPDHPQVLIWIGNTQQSGEDLPRTRKTSSCLSRSSKRWSFNVTEYNLL